MLNVDELPSMLTAYQNRWAERDERMRIIAEAVAGQWATSDDFGDPVENRSPNMIQVALEDTAEAASLVPSVRVKPSGPGDDERHRSEAMERIGVGYLDQSQIELLTIMEMLNLAAYGFCSFVSTINPETGSPYLQWRDPRTCYPEPDYNPMSAVQRCLFVRDVYHTQLPPEWQYKVEAAVAQAKRQTPMYWHDHKTTLLEYYDRDEIVIAALYKTNSGIPGGGARSYLPIELHREPTIGGICPVVIGQTVKLDNEPRGQFDQVVRVMHAHIRLMGTILDYADQAVYCLTPDAKILTENLEYVEAGKLEVGDALVGFDEHPGMDDTTAYRMWRRSYVTHAERRRLPSYRVKLADGTEFTASVQHKWLTGNSGNTSTWIDTAELDRRFHSRHGARVIKPLDMWEQDRSWEAGYLAGVFDGEGWLSANNVGSLRLGFAQRDNACLRDTERCLAHLGFDYSKTSGSGTHGDVFNLQILGGMREIVRFLMTVRPERLIEKFHALGGADYLGRFKRHEMVDVVECEFVDMVEVVALATSTKTIIAEGYAHHNSDVWVKDLIGEMPIGGGSYIQLGPQGAIGRVAPAVPSLSVFQELQSLMDSIHMGGRWPKVRPGEVDQAIASAKFVEATAGMMNTAIRTLHLISKRFLEQALRVMFVQDKEAGRKRTVSGVLRNQQFQIERDRDDIDLGAKITVEYGLGLGREPAQSMVLGIQANQAGLVSTEFVQENFEGITDVALERRRLDLERFRDMALARLMQGLESGEIPESALVEIAKARQNGDDVFELYEKFVVKPKEEAEAQMMTSGLDGAPMMPGMGPPGAGGPTPPAPPGLEQILGGGGPGPAEMGTLARTSVPMGGGSFAGVESRS